MQNLGLGIGIVFVSFIILIRILLTSGSLGIIGSFFGVIITLAILSTGIILAKRSIFPNNQSSNDIFDKFSQSKVTRVIFSIAIILVGIFLFLGGTIDEHFVPILYIPGLIAFSSGIFEIYHTLKSQIKNSGKVQLTQQPIATTKNIAFTTK